MHKAHTQKPDCRNCGACCVSHDNTGGIHADLTKEDIQRLSPYYRRRHVVGRTQWLDRYHDIHWVDNTALASRKHPDGYACVAFKGRVGGPCQCFIYEQRPEICRNFEPGSPECLGARKDCDLG